MTSHCQNCGAPKEPANFRDNYCPSCTQLDVEAQQHFAAENPNATQSDILYAGRQARLARAMRPGNNYMDPRNFSASRRGLPTRPA